MSLIVVEAIRGRCVSFMILTTTVPEIFGGQTNSSILVVQIIVTRAFWLFQCFWDGELCWRAAFAPESVLDVVTAVCGGDGQPEGQTSR